MSLRFYFGPSGAGKSRQLYNEIIAGSISNPQKNYLVIVPDQFTMQTQKDLVMLHDRGGIINIDVLSFGRLGHRILEEVGSKDVPVLDDTGKSLVLQKVASQTKDKLPVLGGLLHKQGYIHEAKSAISEFMQYGLNCDEVDRLIEYAQKRGALAGKLKDLNTLYRAFKEFIQDKFIATEETLDVLTKSLHKSKIIPGSVVVFDGFTGFTPIQYRVIQELIVLCDEVIVSLVMGDGEDPYRLDGEQKLFYLSKKTVSDLEKLCSEAKIGRGKDVFVKCENNRFVNAPALGFLEKNIFRFSDSKYDTKQDEIKIIETVSPEGEVHQIGLMIRELIRKKGYQFRDIAVVSGDLQSYAPYVETEFKKMDIPCYIDRTLGITLNPMIEAIRSALQMYISNFSYEAVFHYLKSTIAGISRDDVDMLENYCIQTGIRGYSKWNNIFTHKTAQMKDDESELIHLNSIRERIMEPINILNIGGKSCASKYVDAMYDFLVANDVQKKMVEMENRFIAEGDLTRAKEYSQIYRLVMELLDQIYGLLGDEEITISEFLDILEAGFGEIEVGTIPQNVDKVLVGDMERTRLKQVKVLIFMGVNDGNIPKNSSKGGIISDMDREFLKESGIELAPTPRQQMFIQKLYLYLNMTKPSHGLIISYSKLSVEGKTLRPSYLIENIKKLFPQIEVQYPENRRVLEQIESKKAGARYLAANFRDYAGGILDEERKQEFYTLYCAYEDEKSREMFMEAAYKRYEDSGLSKAVARALYGMNLENSVTRLETFSACAYRHFLQYGLHLKEREEFEFENVDLGNVYHAILEMFSERLKNSGYTWFDFPKEFAQVTVEEALQSYAATYGDTILYSSFRNAYSIKRMSRVLLRTVMTLQTQLRGGTFTPEGFELSFSFAQDLDSINIALSENEKMRLRGRIDRVDIAEDDENVYVKVIDYKSGNRQFDLAALYHGLQLQLVVYMNAAMEVEAKKHPDKNVIPAALLYYHIDDPTVDTPEQLSDEDINKKIIEKLKMTGRVNSEPGIIEKLDKFMENKSDIVPVERKKDGTLSSRSAVLSGDEMKVVSDYVSYKVRDIGCKILAGDIQIDPYENADKSSCTYCPYKKVCGFDISIPGYGRRNLETVEGSKEEAFILNKMKESIGGGN